MVLLCFIAVCVFVCVCVYIKKLDVQVSVKIRLPKRKKDWKYAGPARWQPFEVEK